MEENNKVSGGENVFLFFSKIGLLAYLILLYMLVWNWYVSDLLFSLTYLQTFLMLVVTRFIFIPNKRKSSVDAEDNNRLAVQIDDIVYSFLSNTLAFGILYIVHVLISYYN